MYHPAISVSRTTGSSPSRAFWVRVCSGFRKAVTASSTRTLTAACPVLDDVFAAGDATTVPIKQGGLAAQQADAAAVAIAASLGVAIDPQPLRPILRGLLLTGDAARYLRADLDGSRVESTVSEVALWWPPTGPAVAVSRPISAGRSASPPT
jgi:sulfide:quinone oxidoreductase